MATHPLSPAALPVQRRIAIVPAALRMTIRSALVVLASAAALACSPVLAAPPQPDFLSANMDRSVDPGKDFFRYANGGWLKRNPIPPSEASWGIGKAVEEQLYVNLRKINDDAAGASQTPGSSAQQIGDFWRVAMDGAKAEQLGIAPLKSELARIDAIKSPRDAVEAGFALQPLGVDAFFSIGVDQDAKASDQMAVYLNQGGLGLPDRDYYASRDKNVVQTRRQYASHIARTLMLLGRESGAASKAAAQVVAFETALAAVSRKLEDLRDPHANYNKIALADVSATLTPSIRWADQLAGWNVRPSHVIVGQPEFFRGLEALLARTPAPVLQDYLRYHLVDAHAPYLSKQFDDEHFSFAGKVLGGQKEPRERWKRVLDAQGDAMGMVMGQIFVTQHFNATAKKRYVDMVEAIRAAYLERINKLSWMSETTKVQARAKLASITPKVGYPDKWKDYSTLAIGQDSYCANMMAAARWHFADMLAKHGKPVDRSEWSMTPQTYNAYYNPSNNEIVLPAAIFLIHGIDDAAIDDAVVYGYAGASTIGHEITHGFDDEGRKFDVKGNLTDWWTADDARKFDSAAAVMVKQYNDYKPLPGLHINGKASLGENIADYGGVLLGLEAFKKTEQYKAGKSIGGLTPTQRYFLGYALAWMNQERDASLRRKLLSDVHAPSKWRVLGPLANMPEFHAAFGIKPGQPMYRRPAEQVNIW